MYFWFVNLHFILYDLKDKCIKNNLNLFDEHAVYKTVISDNNSVVRWSYIEANLCIIEIMLVLSRTKLNQDINCNPQSNP